MVASTKHNRRALRQEVLREYLAERGKASYIFDNIEKLESAGSELTQIQMQGLKAANDQRIKLMAKYLPDTKEISIESVMAATIDNNWTVTIVDAQTEPK